MKMKLTGDKTIEIWLPILKRKFFGFYKVGKWEHHAITFDAKKKEMRYYINGKLNDK